MVAVQDDNLNSVPSTRVKMPSEVCVVVSCLFVVVVVVYYLSVCHPAPK